MWEEVTRLIIEKGGEIHLHSTAETIIVNDDQMISCNIKNVITGKNSTIYGSYFFQQWQ